MFVALRMMFVSVSRHTKNWKIQLIFFFWIDLTVKNFSGATATDALSAGYRTILIDDCCRGVDLQDIEATKESVLNSHGVIVHSKEVRLVNSDYLTIVAVCISGRLFSRFFFMEPHWPHGLWLELLLFREWTGVGAYCSMLLLMLFSFVCGLCWKMGRLREILLPLAVCRFIVGDGSVKQL